MKRKVLFYSVGRSDYDRYLPILENLHKTKIDFAIALNSVHLSRKFGFTFKFIDKKFKTFNPNYTKNAFKDENDIIDNLDDLKALIRNFDEFNQDKEFVRKPARKMQLEDFLNKLKMIKGLLQLKIMMLNIQTKPNKSEELKPKPCANIKGVNCQVYN